MELTPPAPPLTIWDLSVVRKHSLMGWVRRPQQRISEQYSTKRVPGAIRFQMFGKPQHTDAVDFRPYKAGQFYRVPGPHLGPSLVP